MRFFLAFSPPLRIASGTSLALPRPTPTWPLPSPTTTSAEKLNRRPPFTTLATRLMLTTRSLRSRSLGLIGVATPAPFLELEAGLAGRLRHGRDAALVRETVSVEHHPGHVGGLRLLRHQPPHPLGVLLLVALVLSLQLLGEARGERQGAPGGVVHHLGVDVLQALVDREPGTVGGSGHLSPDARLPLHSWVDARHVFLDPSGEDGDLPRRMIGGNRYAVPVFPSLRRTRSSAYLIPLPLYGSGGRRARIFTAVSPSVSRFALRSVRPMVGRLSSVRATLSTSAVTPSGRLKTTGWL